MNQRADYLIQILEHIGAPLMASITAAGKQQGGLEDDARKMAELLGKTVQTGIDMAGSAGLEAAGGVDDSVRLALTALAGPLVAGLYGRNAKIPADDELKKMTAALQAVLSFSENFSPSPENIQRLRALKADGRALDASQVNIQYIQAFLPVVNAISAFSFGQPEQKLATDVASRIVQKSLSLSDALIAEGTDEDARKLLELAVLRALTQIYSACHEQETQRLVSAPQNEEAAAAAGLEPVWKKFDAQATMLEALAASILPGGRKNTAPASAGGPQPAAPPPASPLSPPPAASPPAQAPPEQQQSGAANPLSMFAKPKDGVAPPSPAPTTPPTQAPAGNTTPSQPPAQDGKNPMGFFKKKDDGS